VWGVIGFGKLREENGMKKSDLRDGMIVEFRNGLKLTVRGDYMKNNISYCYALRHWDEDLAYFSDHDYDIIKVIQPAQEEKVLWTRPKPKTEKEKAIDRAAEMIAEYIQGKYHPFCTITQILTDALRSL